MNLQTLEDRPLAFWSESEANGLGSVVPVATIILRAPRCTFRCAHCDLDQHALPSRVASGSVPRQIEWSLERLPPCRWIKLYNGGNFVDRRSIPEEDDAAIQRLCKGFERVIVENHPRLVGPRLFRFQEGLEGQLEVAMGLETADRRILRQLNKRMEPEDFQRGAHELRRMGIDLRTFVIAGFPGEAGSLRGPLRSIEFARRCGARHVSVIPLRPSTPTLKRWIAAEQTPPVRLWQLESIEYKALHAGSAVVTVDPWDLAARRDCDHCDRLRRDRIVAMNLRQRPFPPLSCSRCHSPPCAALTN